MKTKDYPEVTRVEVIDSYGRSYIALGCTQVQVSIQDEGKTLKVFLKSD